MLDRSVLKKLIEHAPLAVTVMGVVVFLAAAAGGLPVGEPPLAVASIGWRISLALLGAGLVVAGVLLMWSGETAIGRGDFTGKAERYGILIDSPNQLTRSRTPR